MTRLKLAVNRRKYGIYLSVCIACVILGFFLGNWFNAHYQVQSPIIKRAMLSPVKIANAASSVSADVLKDSGQKQEASVVVPNYGTGADLKSLVLSYFPSNERAAADELIQRESTWNPNAINPKSGATGLFQALPWSKTGCDSTDDIRCQAAWGAAYVSSRYGTAQNALAHQKGMGWY